MPFAGLCQECRHCAVIRSDRGSEFYRCERHRVSRSFPKYPRLPVYRCGGFEDLGVAKLAVDGVAEDPGGPSDGHEDSGQEKKRQ